MGNIRKFKKQQNLVKWERNANFIKKLNKEELIIWKRLVVEYMSLLRNKEWEKVESMIRFGIEKNKSMILEAIKFVNGLAAHKLNITKKYNLFKEQVRFLVDNPQYAEAWSKDDKIVETEESEAKAKEIFNEQSENLLIEYLNKV